MSSFGCENNSLKKADRINQSNLRLRKKIKIDWITISAVYFNHMGTELPVGYDFKARIAFRLIKKLILIPVIKRYCTSKKS